MGNTYQNIKEALTNPITKGKDDWIWKSIVHAIDIMKKHICWEIGNGKNIKIWEDKWLPTKDNYKVNQNHILSNHHYQHFVTVYQLITPNTTNWDNTTLATLFDNPTIAHIKAIKVGGTHREDNIRWMCEKMVSSQFP